MKRLDTTPITTGIGMPIKSGILDFLQDAHKETASDMVANMLGFQPDANTMYILSGCVNSNTAPTYNVSAGVVFYNGEIYEVPAFNFTTTGSDLPYPNLVITQFTTNADPVNFTDGTPRNVCNIRKIVVTATSTSTGYPTFDNWYHAGAWIGGDLKDIICTSTYQGIHFDSTGLGRKERKGWAICNGSNGTPDLSGRVNVANGTQAGFTYTLGATGGNKNAVQQTKSGAQSAGGLDNTTAYENDTTHNNLVNANMPPYYVTLRIMKLNM